MSGDIPAKEPGELTPVQTIDGAYFKRDDLFRPFAGGVNGGKLRQCMMLVSGLAKRPEGLITYCSIHSPQAPITAATAKWLKMPCVILYGGTHKDTLMRLAMPRLCLFYGAKIRIAAKSGRHNVLYAKARQLEKDNGYFIVQYGINIMDHSSVLLEAVSRQAENLPEEIDDLFMVCGSGITATGVMIGLKKYGKHVRKMHLVATGPNREKMIHQNLQKYGADRFFYYHSLFDTPGFSYDKREHFVLHGITFHPNYEAKMMKWYMQSGLRSGKTLFWITGAEPEGVII